MIGKSNRKTRKETGDDGRFRSLSDEIEKPFLGSWKHRKVQAFATLG